MPIHKRETKGGVRYTAVVRVTGQTTMSETFATHVEAKRWLTAQHRKLDDGAKVASRKVRETVLGDLLPIYAEKVAAKRGRTDTGSGRCELATLARLSDSFLGEMPVVKIEPCHVERWLANRRDERKPDGQPFADSTLRRSLDILAAVLWFAARTLPIERYRNPCHEIDPKKRPKGSRARERNLREGEFDEFERQLALYCDGEFIDLLRVSALTGFRRSEIAMLNEGWINWDDGTVDLPVTKTGAQTRALTPPALAILGRLVPGEGGRYFPYTPDRITHVTTLLSRRTSIMIAARRLAGGRFANAIQLALMIPQFRIEEISTFRADRIDWAEGVLKFDNPNPKSTALRRREVSEDVMQFVRGLTPESERYYFAITPEEIRAAWQTCLKQADWLGTFSPHILRAAFTTALLEAGLPAAVVGKFTGHDDARSIERYTRIRASKASKNYGAQAEHGLRQILGDASSAAAVPICAPETVAIA